MLRNILFTIYVLTGLLILNPPEGLWNFSLFDRYDFYLRALIVAVTGILFLIGTVRKKEVDAFLVFYLLFDAVLILSTFLFQGDLKKAVWSNTIVPAALIMLVAVAVEYDRKITVQAVYFIFYASVLCNCFLVFKYYGMSLTYIPVSEHAFLGNRNAFIYYYLILLFIGYYGLKKGFFRHRWHYFIGYGVCLITSLKSQGLTTVVLLLLWGMFLLLNRPAEHIFGKLPNIGIVLNALLFVILQIYALSDGSRLFGWLSILKKSSSFRGRTPIWRTVWEQISISPMIGYGYRDMWDAIGKAHPHNLYLHIMLNRGMMGFAGFIILVAILQKASSRVHHSKIRILMLFFLSCLLLASQFDEYVDSFYALYGALVFYLCKAEAVSDGKE